MRDNLKPLIGALRLCSECIDCCIRRMMYFASETHFFYLIAWNDE